MKKKNCFFINLLLFIGAFTASLSASSFTEWNEYSGNPVFAPFPSTTLPDDYFPCVLFDNARFKGDGDRVFYKMWHQGPDGITLSYSNDGINWVVQSQVILDPNALHPVVIYNKDGFAGGYHYQMWYWTGNASPTPPNIAIKFAQSADGITWTTPVDAAQDATNFLSDVNASNTPFHQFYGFGSVIYNSSATSTPGDPFSFPYVTFYDSSAAEISPFTSQEAVALAYSDDGVNWVRYGTDPVLIPSGNTADWDGKYAYRASVVKLHRDGLYHMFYSGSDGDGNSGLFYAHGIGHAKSFDGINWLKDSDNPIFSVTDFVAWRSDHVLAPTVIISHKNEHNPILLQMWFSGGNSSSGGSPEDKAIGYAVLPNPF